MADKANRFSSRETINTLTAIFERHRGERVCVLGTMCCGKTTLLSQMPHCLDMDAEAFSRITAEEAAFISQTPWTREIGDEVDRIVFQNVKIRPGFPVFGTVILDCEAVVYLDIDDDLLAAHCEKRGVPFGDAKGIKDAIERDWDNHRARGDKTLYYVKLTE